MDYIFYKIKGRGACRGRPALPLNPPLNSGMRKCLVVPHMEPFQNIYMRNVELDFHSDEFLVRDI